MALTVGKAAASLKWVANLGKGFHQDKAWGAKEVVLHPLSERGLWGEREMGDSPILWGDTGLSNTVCDKYPLMSSVTTALLVQIQSILRLNSPWL